jgi:hypothetical protein
MTMRSFFFILDLDEGPTRLRILGELDEMPRS